MKKIKFYLEYQCYPLWIYNESGNLIDNRLIEELVGKEIENTLHDIQSVYDHLFIDDGISFEYKGFPTVGEKTDFLNKVKLAAEQIANMLVGQYIIENKVTI
jgi:hypothetical protein